LNGKREQMGGQGRIAKDKMVVCASIESAKVYNPGAREGPIKKSKEK